MRCFCLGDFSLHDSGLRSGAARAAMSLHPTKEAEQFGVKVIVMDMPRPPKHHPAIDVQPSGNGKPPTDNNGHD